MLGMNLQGIILGTATAGMGPVLVVALCILAGIGTVMLLPSRREASVRKIGGLLLLAAGLFFATVLIRFVSPKAGDGGMGIYFWIFSAVALLGAVRVVTHPQPVYSALYFVMTVMASAGLFVLLWAEFMAAALVLIYAGAILVTYVFVIMLASQGGAGAREMTDYDRVSREPTVAGIIGFGLMAVFLIVLFDRAQALPTPKAGAEAMPLATGTVQELGQYLFTHQLVNLELAGLILTMSMVGAIIIAKRRVIFAQGEAMPGVEMVSESLSPTEDDPHSIPVYGTDNPLQKAYPEN